MKLSVMTLNMLFPAMFKFSIDHDEEDFEEYYDEMMQIVSECGYEAVDVCIEATVLPVERIMAILDKYSLNVSSYIHMETFAAERDCTEQIEKAKAAADLAITLGAKVLMLAPQAHDGIEACPAEEIQNRLISNFTPVCAYAKEQGLHVVIEDTPDLRMHLCSTKDLKKVLNAVPGLELVYDSGNMILVDEAPVEYYRTFVQCVGHIHLKDMKKIPADDPMAQYADVALNGDKYLTASTGTGVIDLKGVIQAIQESGYNGYMTVEFQVDNDGDHRKSLIRCREYLERISE